MHVCMMHSVYDACVYDAYVCMMHVCMMHMCVWSDHHNMMQISLILNHDAYIYDFHPSKHVTCL